MALPSHSQNTLVKEPNRVTTFVNEYGDTMVSMSLSDAKILLEDVLKYEYTDSLLFQYKVKDSLQLNTIAMQKEVLVNLSKEKFNLEQINGNLQQVIDNKDKELGLKDEIIKDQKKEIRKQKSLKILGFTGSVVLPILTLILVL